MIKDGVLIGYVSGGDVRVEFASSLTNVVAYSMGNKIPIVGTIPKMSGPRIASSRNRIVEHFLASDAEWLFMVDTDMTFPADVVERFLKVSDKKKAPIVGGLCFGRGGEGLFPTIYRWTGESFVRPEGWDPNTMVECDGTGAACLFVHRSVFEKVAENFRAPFQWFQEGTILGDAEVGEDMAFCMRVRALDIPIFVHTGIPFGHVKEFEIDTKFYKDWCRSHQVIVTGVPSDSLKFVSSVLQQVKIPADFERFFNPEWGEIPEWGRADVSWFAAPHLLRHAGAHIVEIVSDDDEPIEKALADHGDWIRQYAPEVTDVASFREAWTAMIDPYVTQRMTVEQVTPANILPAAIAAGGMLSERHIERAFERVRS